jgi:hypothetical protein
MDLSFLFANLVAFLAKTIWFQKDSRARDIVLPILVVVGNFIAQLVLAIQGDQVGAKLVSDTLSATAASLGLDRGVRWASKVGGK